MLPKIIDAVILALI